MPNFVNRLDCLYSYCWFSALFAFLLTTGIQAQSRQSLEEQRKKALQEIEETTHFLNETEKNRSESVDKLNLLIVQEKQFNRLISGINAEIAFADRQISETTAKISRMNNEIEKMKTEYARLVFQAYKNRGQNNKLVFVLSARDFNEAYRRLKYFQQYSEYRKKQVAEIKTRQDELQVVNTQLATQKTEKEKLLAEQLRESKRLEAVKVEQNREVANLRSKERTLKNQLTAQQQKEKRLQAEIQKLVAAEIKKRNNNSTNISDRLTPDERLISDNFRGNKGRLPWPTERGTVTSFFGNNPHAIFSNIRINNNGIDITTVGGATVRAVFDGVVSGILTYLGNLTVLVRHGNYITVYSNLVEVSVKYGEKLKSKQPIGKVYTEKGTNTAVLHFEIWDANKPNPEKLNPELWISKN